MRLIDASELIQVLCINMDSGEQFDKATHCVDVMPTVDAVEVIRCKDCKYYNDRYKWCDAYVLVHLDIEKDGYCSRAERKEECQE